MKQLSTEYYTIVVMFKTKPGKEELFKRFLASVIDIAFESPGCIMHTLHQSYSCPAEFMFYENWINKEAHEQHIARAEVKEWRTKLNSFLENPYQVSFWKTT